MSKTLPPTLPDAEGTILRRRATDQVADAPSVLASTAVVDASSLPQMAQEISVLARERAEKEAAYWEAVALREQLELERTALAMQRADAEQSYRVAESLHACQQLLVESLTQPCIVLSPDGYITDGNTALVTWGGLGEDAFGTPLERHLDPAVGTRFRHDLRAAVQAASTLSPPAARPFDGPVRFVSGRIAARLTFVPLCRIPGYLEAFFLLLDPR